MMSETRPDPRLEDPELDLSALLSIVKADRATDGAGSTASRERLAALKIWKEALVRRERLRRRLERQAENGASSPPAAPASAVDLTGLLSEKQDLGRLDPGLLAQAREVSDVGRHLPEFPHFGRVKRFFARKMARMVFYLAGILTAHQRIFNSALLNFSAESAARTNHLAARLEQLADDVSRLADVTGQSLRSKAGEDDSRFLELECRTADVECDRAWLRLAEAEHRDARGETSRHLEALEEKLAPILRDGAQQEKAFLDVDRRLGSLEGRTEPRRGKNPPLLSGLDDLPERLEQLEAFVKRATSSHEIAELAEQTRHLLQTERERRDWLADVAKRLSRLEALADQGLSRTQVTELTERTQTLQESATELRDRLVEVATRLKRLEETDRRLSALPWSGTADHANPPEASLAATIRRLYSESDFDFRAFAHPGDPLHNRFEEWQPHYRLKHAIAAALQPRSILEIGVRYGYSAIAFLSACSDARYLGLDNDSDTFGGVRGSFAWAKRVTRGMDASFMLADTQELVELPGDGYDLVHVDGQQDGEGTYHDLWMALDQAKFILLDGFTWSDDNYRSACQLLVDRQDHIEHYFVLPAHAGELLIRVSDDYRELAKTYRNGPEAGIAARIQGVSTAGYYAGDSGHGAFGVKRVKELSDLRLEAVFNLSSPRAGGSFLDLACGHGELVLKAARKGATVTAVDCSAEAIEATRKLLDGQEELRRKVELIRADLSELELNRRFDRVVAANLVEHLRPEELDALLPRVAEALSPDGRLVINAAPSRWYLRRGHESRRRRALEQRRYLPRDPKTAYERLTHVHEVSPADLRRRLRAHFAHTLVWVGDFESDPTGSLTRRFSRREYLEAREIFAIASHRPIDTQKVVDLLRQLPLEPSDMGVQIQIRSQIGPVDAGAVFEVPVLVENRGPKSLATHAPAPVYLSYHWGVEGEKTHAIWEGLRTDLPSVILEGESVAASVRVAAPAAAGNYRLQVSLIQEGHLWFEKACPELPAEIVIEVRERPLS